MPAVACNIAEKAVYCYCKFLSPKNPEGQFFPKTEKLKAKIKAKERRQRRSGDALGNLWRSGDALGNSGNVHGKANDQPVHASNLLDKTANTETNPQGYRLFPEAVGPANEHWSQRGLKHLPEAVGPAILRPPGRYPFDMILQLETAGPVFFLSVSIHLDTVGPVLCLKPKRRVGKHDGGYCTKKVEGKTKSQTNEGSLEKQRMEASKRNPRRNAQAKIGKENRAERKKRKGKERRAKSRRRKDPEEGKIQGHSKK